MNVELAYDIQGEYDTYHYDIKLVHGINLLQGNSGKGKTLLLRLLCDLMNNNNMDYAFVDARIVNKQESELIAMCRQQNLIMLDNADIYLTSSLVNDILSCAAINAVIIVAMHIPFPLMDFKYMPVEVETRQGIVRTIPGVWRL